MSALSFPFGLGACGVALFFVLSGYCIHRPNSTIALNPDGRLNLRKYFIRRVWRIYPVLFGAILLTAVLDHYVVKVMPNDDKLGSLNLLVALLNIATLQGVVGPVFGSNGPLWSLGPEVHVYILYPILYIGCRRWGAERLLVLSAIISVLALGVKFLFPHLIVPAVFPYLFAWVCGMFVAEVEIGRAPIPIDPSRTALLALGVMSFVAQWLRPDIAMLFHGVFFGLLLYSSIKGKLASVWSRTSLRGLVWVGSFSYSLYAIHVPILVFCRAFMFEGQRQLGIWVPYAGVVFAIGCAWLFYQAVERFSLRPPAFLMPRLVA